MEKYRKIQKQSLLVEHQKINGAVMSKVETFNGKIQKQRRSFDEEGHIT